MSEQERDDHGRFAGGGGGKADPHEKAQALRGTAYKASATASKSGSKDDHLHAAKSNRIAALSLKESGKSKAAAEHHEAADAHDKAAGKDSPGKLSAERARTGFRGSPSTGLWASKRGGK